MERIKESAGLELDMDSLALHNSVFWHHRIKEINNNRHETTRDEDRILGAGPPSNGICIISSESSFIIHGLYAYAHTQM